MYVRSDYRAKRGCICISQLVSQTAWQLHDPLALSCPWNNPVRQPRSARTGNRFNTLSVVLPNEYLEFIRLLLACKANRNLETNKPR